MLNNYSVESNTIEMSLIAYNKEMRTSRQLSPGGLPNASPSASRCRPVGLQMRADTNNPCLGHQQLMPIVQTAPDKTMRIANDNTDESVTTPAGQ